MPDKLTLPPDPLEETVRWCEINRPDVVHDMRSLAGNDALVFLVALGFAAGRAFQAAPAHAEAPMSGRSPYP